MVPSSPNSSNAARSPEKLSGRRQVDFFTVGKQSGRTLVIFKYAKGVSINFSLIMQKPLCNPCREIVFSGCYSPTWTPSIRVLPSDLRCCKALDLSCDRPHHGFRHTGSVLNNIEFQSCSKRAYRTFSYLQKPLAWCF